MADILDTLLFGDESSAEEQASLRKRFEDDPALAEAWAHWRAAHLHIREQLQEQLSDHRLLVLYVLEQEGETQALTSEEQRALADARDDIAQAIDRIPALERVVERIREARSDFDEIWETHLEDVEDSVSVESDRASRFGEREDRSARPSQSQQTSSARSWTRRLVGGAVVMALAVAIAFFWMQGPETTTLTVADGTVRTVSLQDGSTVRLVGPASFTHPSQPSETGPRHVTLDRGRAFFDVQKQEQSSFTVKTPTATATVLGTQFGVSTAADTTEVVLADGSVRVGSADGENDTSITLKPGQKSWVAKGEAPASPAPVDLTTELEWTGFIVLRSVPMETVAQRLSQRYDVQVSVDSSLAGESVTGTFEQKQSVQQVLTTLATTLGAEVEGSGEEAYRLVPAP